MAIELQILLGISAYGALQGLIAGHFNKLQQVHRNFSETAFLFMFAVLFLSVVDGFGAWSQKGALAYAIGRGLYLSLSIESFRPFRKWAWAISIAGIVGCIGELVRVAMD